MQKRRHEARAQSSAANVDSEEPKIDINSILKEIEFLESPHMTWKQKKDMQNKKVVSLGGKPQKKQRLPLSVARVTMKKQKEREEKMLKENALLARFGIPGSGSGAKKEGDKHRSNGGILRSTEGNFRNGILDVKHLMKSTAPQPRMTESGSSGFGGGRGKKKNGGKKGHGKKKGGGRKKHH